MRGFYKSEMAKYDDFVIETDSTRPSKKKKRKNLEDEEEEYRVTHDWTDRETSSLIGK